VRRMRGPVQQRALHQGSATCRRPSPRRSRLRRIGHRS
jgi:hypothetical protein